MCHYNDICYNGNPLIETQANHILNFKCFQFTIYSPT